MTSSELWSINAGGESEVLDYTVERGVNITARVNGWYVWHMAICIQQAGS
jgi:hypothetical protein